MLKIIKDNIWLKHLLLSLVTLILLFVGWLQYLDVYTKHNSFIKVPDFNAFHISELDSISSSYMLRYEIIDSVFDKSKQKGIVVNQIPLPNTNVKENRKIYLTINSLRIRKVIFPDIFDLTLREAVSKIKEHGLEVGILEYQANIATNKVLSFKVNGLPIKIGQELYYGTTVDLVVGRGLSHKRVAVPDLSGLSRSEANVALKLASLNIGIEYFDNEVVDSSLAVIYRQYPVSGVSKTISIGSYIDLYFGLTKDRLE